jgi:hypothetical protein
MPNRKIPLLLSSKPVVERSLGMDSPDLRRPRRNEKATGFVT